MMQGQIFAWLVDERDSSNRYAMEGDVVTVGRGSTCQIRLDDPKVSRTHACLSRRAGQIVIEDLNSTHGVLVNGQRVTNIFLNDGDRVQLGDTDLKVELVQEAVETVMAPPGVASAEGPRCRYCESPIALDQAYCGTCGAITRELPEPFEFIQKAYLQLCALHRFGRMDTPTFRAELEKMVVSDGSGGYWMVGVQSGRWHWFNGSVWVLRDPPSKALKQGTLADAPPPPPPPTPAPPPPAPGLVDVEEGRAIRRFFFIGGGALAAISILAIGVYTAYQWITGDAQDSIPEVLSQPTPISTIPLAEPTDVEQVLEIPSVTPLLPTEAPLPSETPSLPYHVRPYDPALDEGLDRLGDLAEFVEAGSSQEYAIYEGVWYVEQPALFTIGWCAIDQATLTQNLQVIQMSLDIDGRHVDPAVMFDEDFSDPTVSCRSSKMVVEFLEPGEHRLLWTTSYTEPVNDGWQDLPAGTYLNEYVYQVKNVISMDDAFEQRSGKWDETEQQNFSQWTEAGSFHIQVHQENFVAWSLYHDQKFNDGLIMAQARRVSDSTGAYGLLFRYQDVNNFYYFMVDDSGFFRLGKRFSGEWIDLIEWTYSESIFSGEAFNHLGVMMTGDELVAFINNEVAGSVIDTSFQLGDVGLIAQSAGDQEGMHAEFDVFYLEYYE
jgi:hypothetical protein